VKYVVIIEHDGDIVGAYPPDLPGVGVTAESEEEALHLVQEAIAMHVEQLQADGQPVPQPSCSAQLVEV